MSLSEQVVNWTREWFREAGRTTAVLGISGGKDSAVVAAILTEALGAGHVVGVMMPNGTQKDIADARQVVSELGICGMTVNVGDAYQSLCAAIGAVSPEAAINLAPRLRMSVLYAVAQSLSVDGVHACVVGTGNKAERYVGYTTKWGDGACDVNPIQDLWVHEVVRVGEELGYFPNIVHKSPDDGLCGQTDEEKLGFSYQDVARAAQGDPTLSPELARRIQAKHLAALHKLVPIPCFQHGWSDP